MIISSMRFKTQAERFFKQSHHFYLCLFCYFLHIFFHLHLQKHPESDGCRYCYRDDNGIFKIDYPAFIVCKPAIIQNL